MLETYKAIIRGNQIRWNGESPDAAKAEVEVEAYITILTKVAESTTQRPSGLAKGDFIVPDDFDASLSEEVLAGFEN